MIEYVLTEYLIYRIKPITTNFLLPNLTISRTAQPRVSHPPITKGANLCTKGANVRITPKVPSKDTPSTAEYAEAYIVGGEEHFQNAMTMYGMRTAFNPTLGYAKVTTQSGRSVVVGDKCVAILTRNGAIIKVVEYDDLVKDYVIMTRKAKSSKQYIPPKQKTGDGRFARKRRRS